MKLESLRSEIALARAACDKAEDIARAAAGKHLHAALVALGVPVRDWKLTVQAIPDCAIVGGSASEDDKAAGVAAIAARAALAAAVQRLADAEKGK